MDWTLGNFSLICGWGLRLLEVVISALNAHKVERSRSKKEPNACILLDIGDINGFFLIWLRLTYSLWSFKADITTARMRIHFASLHVHRQSDESV